MAEALGPVLDRLWRAINARHGGDPETSYTARLFRRGRVKIAQKLGEEAVEAVIEGVRGDRAGIVGGSGAFFEASGTYRVAAVPEDPQDAKVRLTNLSGVACSPFW